MHQILPIPACLGSPVEEWIGNRLGPIYDVAVKRLQYGDEQAGRPLLKTVVAASPLKYTLYPFTLIQWFIAFVQRSADSNLSLSTMEVINLNKTTRLTANWLLQKPCLTFKVTRNLRGLPSASGPNKVVFSLMEKCLLTDLRTGQERQSPTSILDV